jgi:hypothetical protein
MFSLNPNFVSMRLVAPSRLPTSINIQRTTIVHFVLPRHFIFWMLSER